MSVLKLERKNDGTLVKLGDHLNISCANDLYKDLDKALARKPEKIIFDTGSLQRADTATLQLLIACVKEAKRLKKNVSWAKVNKEFRECADITGASEALGL